MIAYAFQKVQEVKQEAQVDNEIRYNQIKSGRLYLGVGNVTVTKDWRGSKTYNVK